VCGPVSKSSYFLGDPPPAPVFSLRSARCQRCSSITALSENPGPKDLLVSHRNSRGILPQTPVLSLRSARCQRCSSITALSENPGPEDLLVSHRTSWGILPQTPVFSLRSERGHWYSFITALSEYPGPKNPLSYFMGDPPPDRTPDLSLRSSRCHRHVCGGGMNE
jgi:hypothetical protein